jgi:hypothetical protein
MAVSVVAVTSPAQAAKPGNSTSAKQCQKGGWQNLVRTDGTAFTSEKACRSYAAKGGILLPKGPDAVDDNAATNVVGDNAVGFVVDVLKNDTDPEGDSLTVVSVQQVAGAGHFEPFGAGAAAGLGITFYLDGAFDVPAGQAVTAAADYTVSDGHGGTDSARISIQVVPPMTPMDECQRDMAAAGVTPPANARYIFGTNDPNTVDSFGATDPGPDVICALDGSNEFTTLASDDIFVGGNFSANATFGNITGGIFIGGGYSDYVESMNSGTYIGGAGNDDADTLYGDSRFIGGTGNDGVVGVNDNSTFDGGTGDDFVQTVGGLGTAMFNGGPGTDKTCLASPEHLTSVEIVGGCGF